MNFRRSLVLFVMLITAPWLVAFAQEANEINMQWVWGEVVSLDSQAKTLILKYLDYETDQEKELALVIDEKTTYENIKSFDEIKVKDILSIDYAAGPEDKNVAKNISLEKPDNLPPVAPAQAIKDAKPVLAQPIAQPETAAGSSTAVTETPPPAPAAAGQAQ